jgi:hypothetical protein
MLSIEQLFQQQTDGLHFPQAHSFFQPPGGFEDAYLPAPDVS